MRPPPRGYGPRGALPPALAAPEALNSLPFSIRSIDSADCFTNNLRTHLFNVAFNPWYFAYFVFTVVLAVRRPCCIFISLTALKT